MIAALAIATGLLAVGCVGLGVLASRLHGCLAEARERASSFLAALRLVEANAEHVRGDLIHVRAQLAFTTGIASDAHAQYAAAHARAEALAAQCAAHEAYHATLRDICTGAASGSRVGIPLSTPSTLFVLDEAPLDADASAHEPCPTDS